jgi:hypothetical protein
VVVAVLQEVVVVILQEVVVTILWEVVVVTFKKPKSKIIHCKTNRTVDRAYLEFMVPFMVSYPTPYNIKSSTK